MAEGGNNNGRSKRPRGLRALAPTQCGVPGGQARGLVLLPMVGERGTGKRGGKNLLLGGVTIIRGINDFILDCPIFEGGRKGFSWIPETHLLHRHSVSGRERRDSPHYSNVSSPRSSGFRGRRRKKESLHLIPLARQSFVHHSQTGKDGPSPVGWTRTAKRRILVLGE